MWKVLIQEINHIAARTSQLGNTDKLWSIIYIICTTNTIKYTKMDHDFEGLNPESRYYVLKADVAL